MNFLRRVRDSIYNPDFYCDLPAKPFRWSLGYYYTLALVVAIVVTVVFSFYAIPALQSFLSSVGPKILQYYPAELVVTLKGGSVSTNVAEPYVIPMPPELKNPENGSFDNLLVIDTKDPFTLDAFNKYRTAALLTKNSLVYTDSQNKVTIQPLGRAGDMTIDKNKIASVVGGFQPYLKYMSPLVVFLLFIAFMAMLSFKLVYMFVAAFLVWIVAKIKKFPLGYWKAYQLALHLFTLSLVVDYLMFVLGAGSVLFLPSAILLVMAFLNLQPQPVPISVSPPTISESPSGPSSPQESG